MEQDQVGRDDDRASVGGASSLDFNFLVDHEEGTETLAGANEPEEDELPRWNLPQLLWI